MSRIVDAHAHVLLHGYGIIEPQDPAVLVDQFTRHGVDQAWYSSADALICNQSDLHRRCNDQMAELQSEFGARFVALATVNPRDGEAAARELERAVTQLDIRGLKLHGWLQPVSCCDPCLEPLFEAANRFRLVVLLHDGTPPFTNGLQIGWLAERYPDCTMILGHGGLKDAAINAVQAVRRYPNVHMQTPATTLRALRYALDAVGPDRILYGSDGGFGDPRWIGYNLRKIRRWALPGEAESRILGENASKLLERTMKP